MEIRPHIRLLHGMRRPGQLAAARPLRPRRRRRVHRQPRRLHALRALRSGSSTTSPRSSPGSSRCVNNFVLNRHWTFDARGGRARFQAVRFLLVSLVAVGFSLLLLTVFVEGGRHRQGAGAGARGGGVDAAELPRQQAVELSGARLRIHAGPGSAGSSRTIGRRSAGTYTLAFPPLGGFLCRRWSSTASALTWLASSRSCS